MRIALVRQRYNPYGGAERFIERTLQALAAEGVAVTVYAREWKAAPAVVRCDPFYLGRLWRDWGFARAVCRALAASGADLVQSHERLACCDVYRAGDGVHAQWLENRRAALGPLARLALALNPYHRYLLAVERRLFTSARLRAVICNSRMVKEEIRRRFGTPEHKLRVIYNGVDLEAFHPRLRPAHRAEVRGALGIAQEALVFLFVGAGFERKGVFPLLEAFARARLAGAHLVVVGGDRALARSRKRAAALGLGARVHFTGARSEVRPYYGAADVFVLPSLYDPFPNAALEAMACGLPIVTTGSCGAAELVEPDASGYVVPARDVAALAAALERFDPVCAAAMGARARKRAEGFGLEAMAARLLVLYRELLGLRPGAGDRLE